MSLDFSNFKKLSIGGVELSKLSVSPFKNWVASAIDTDGSLYNGCGYIDGYRLSSSGALKEQANTVTTGFMPCRTTSVIKMDGTTWVAATNEYCYLSFYDMHLNHLGALNHNNSVIHEHGIATRDMMTYKVVDGITIFELAIPENLGVCYFRISATGAGSQMVVAVDEEIEDARLIWERYLYKNWVEHSTDTDGSIYNGKGYKDNARLSSSGSVSGSAQNGSVVVGFIPFKNTDVICMKGAEWLHATANYQGHYYFYLYDSNKKAVSNGYMASNSYDTDAGFRSQISVTYDEATGVTTFQIIDPTGTTGTFRDAAKKASYFRINAYGKGANLIITVNEEI